jgi:phosphatidylglycerol:prolipoprotein diacylglycerol transferase
MEILQFYQNIPSLIDPIIFKIESFSIRWYSLMYVVGFFVVFVVLYWRAKKEEFFGDIKDGKSLSDRILELLVLLFAGVIIGGRLGYVLFYDLGYFLNHPIEIFSPFDPSGRLIGLYGMSYHGGFLGFIVVLWLYSKKNKFNFWKLSDLIVLAIPLGYFFGRIGNFLNHELYGRVTQKVWGMNFGGDVLRHPSQLYEAFFEGVVLFVVLWKLRTYWQKKPGVLTGIYVLGYGFFRFFIEFFREPDYHLGLYLSVFTIGQFLSFLMICVGTWIIFCSKNKR